MRSPYAETAAAREMAANSSVGRTDRALGALLPPDPPVPGWTLGYDGPISTAGLQPHSERELLERHEFVAGWSRNFVAASGVFQEGAAVLTVYEFARGEQAVAFERSALDGGCPQTFDAYAIVAVPGAIGVERHGSGVVHDVISFVQGPRYFRLDFGRPSERHDRQEAERAAANLAATVLKRS
ncbi:MAG TPA: hypothetical protein VK988_15420 [Acidimicrobiales bacterium]|nr:hypothetical protein [Acidimicrobiales bacterium]